MAKANLPAGAELGAALFFSCTARKTLLGTRTREEIKLVRDMLGEGVPACGFYGYGEISPNNGDSRRTQVPQRELCHVADR